jgi:Glycosyltransferase like family 2
VVSFRGETNRSTVLASTLPVLAMPDRLRHAGYSFCIITDGRRPEMLREQIDSIRAQSLEAYEIIVAGNVPPSLADTVVVVEAADLAFAGRLGAMRNRACAAAQYDRLIVADDDMFFHPHFGEALQAAGADYDVLCVRLLNPDGTRFWDWATIGGPRGHRLLAYDEVDDFVYVTGGLAIMRATVHDRVPWDEARGFYQGEDVEWSARVRAAGCRIRFTPEAVVTHRDPRYTQHGHVMRFRQDLTLFERLAHGVDGAGFYRPQDAGFRWMSVEGTLRVDALATTGRTLHFALTSAALELSQQAVTVTVAIDGVDAGAFVFNGPETLSADLPLAPGLPTTITLRSDRSVSGTLVGLTDTREVSVLLHDVGIRAG